MKRIITDQKSKIKQKLKSKSKVKLSSKNKVKINKQNQNVKVNIKIGGVDKKEEINRSSSMQPNSIMSYPLFQDAQPPVNIIHNQPRERLVDHPIQIPLQTPVTIPRQIPDEGRIKSSYSIKKLRKIKKIRKKLDVIPSPSGYESEVSLQNFYDNLSPTYEYKNAMFNQPGTKTEYTSDNENKYLSPIVKTTASPYLRIKVKNPKTGRFVYTDGKVYQKSHDNVLPLN